MTSKTKLALRLLLAVLVTLPLASCHKKANPALIGAWEGKANNKLVYLTFEKDGQLELGGDISAWGALFTQFTMLTDFGIRPGKNTPITYKCVSDSKMEVESDLTAMMEGLSAGGRNGGAAKPSRDVIEKLHPKETLTFAVAGKELTLTNARGASVKLTKVD